MGHFLTGFFTWEVGGKPKVMGDVYVGTVLNVYTWAASGGPEGHGSSLHQLCCSYGQFLEDLVLLVFFAHRFCLRVN